MLENTRTTATSLAEDLEQDDRGGREYRTPSQTTVLIVEDDAPLLELARRSLSGQAFHVAGAGTAESGIEHYLASNPDLVLLDVALPDRSGFDVCETIRSLPGGSAVPIVIMTGLDDAETIAQAYSCGASDFVVKPINWTVLGNRIRLLIEAGQTRRHLASNRSKLRKAERIARLGTWEFNLTTESMSASEETARILGISPDETSTPQALLATVHPLDSDKAAEAFESMVEELTEIDFEHRLIWPDGSVRTVHHRGQLRRDQAGHAASVQGVTQDITDLRRAEDKLRHLANYDRLTGLPNRHLFLELLDGALARSQRTDHLAAVVYLDLDRFKKINEIFGPEVGDEVLANVADRIRISLRRGDFLTRDNGPSVARWGGDKFLVLLSDLDDLRGAARAVQRLMQQLAIPFSVSDHDCFLTACAGVAVFPTDGQRSYELLQHAESATFHAKTLGSNRLQFYSEQMSGSSVDELDLENKLHQAVLQNELHLAYQPIIDGRSAEIVGVEALLRWSHPDLGSVPPEEFIPIAESAGMISALGEWVLRTACRDLESWFEQGMSRIRLSVNVSSHQLRDGNFTERVSGILRETGFDPQLLDFEISERGEAIGDARCEGSLAELKKLGIQVVIDDFGVGNSALAYLKSFPLDVLKVDRSFISGIEEDSSDSAILSAVITMAHRLGIQVVGKGVETDEQLRFLQSQGCDYFQGFLFAKPLTAAQFCDSFDQLGADFEKRATK